MINKLGWYYIWTKHFSSSERKQLLAFFLRVVIEYCGYFLLLSHHHSIAMIIFDTTSWYPVTMYFEIIFCLTFLGSFILTYLLFIKQYAGKYLRWLEYLSFFGLFFYLVFFALGLNFLKTSHVSQIKFLFIVISVFFLICNGYEKYIRISNLLVIASDKIKYLFLTQGFFLSIAIGLFAASFCIKASLIGGHHHFNQMELMVIPTLAFSFLSAVVDCSIYHSSLINLRLLVITDILNKLRIHRKELLARLLVNLMIGVFLVKWYFNLPFLLQYSEKWTPSAIANIILICSVVSILGGLVFRYLFKKFDIYKLFTYSILIYLALISIIHINLYYHYMVGLSVIMMALLYNFLNGIINRIIHHNYIDISINIVLLIVGSAISIVVIAFISSSISIVLAKKIGIQSTPIVNALVLLTVSLLGLFGFYKMERVNEI